MYTKLSKSQSSFLNRSLQVLMIIALLLVSFPVSAALAADTGYSNPSVASSAGKGWSNPTFSFLSDDTYASTSGKNKQLKLSSFNFPSVSGTVTGIEVAVEGHTAGLQASVVISGDGGVTWSPAKNTALPIGSDNIQIMGGSTDKWGLSWTTASFTNAKFLVKITSKTTGTGPISVDQLRVKVYYQSSTTTLTISPVTENYGTATTSFSATLTDGGGSPISGKTIAFKLNGVSKGTATTDSSGIASLSGVNISNFGAGTYTIHASFAGNSSYQAASGDANLNITPLPLTVTADPNQSKYYGYTDPALTYTLTSGALLGSDHFTGYLSRQPGETLGTYSIDQGTLTAGSNYTITFNGDIFTINPAPLTVTATSLAKLATDPAITTFPFTYSGFATNEDESVLTTTPTCGVDPSVDQSVLGQYAITCSGGAAANYTFNYVNGTLTVNAVAGPFISIASEDGWVRESAQGTRLGGAVKVSGKGSQFLLVGDDAYNRQYRSIVSFDLSAVPAGAHITSITLDLTYAGKAGTIPPFKKLGSLLLDLKVGDLATMTGAFGTNSLLQKNDFQAAPTLKSAGIVSQTPVSTSPVIYEAALSPTALAYINGLSVHTQLQLRLRFQKATNLDSLANLARFYSSDSTDVNSQPVLTVVYTMP